MSSDDDPAANLTKKRKKEKRKRSDAQKQHKKEKQLSSSDSDAPSPPKRAKNQDKKKATSKKSKDKKSKKSKRKDSVHEEPSLLDQIHAMRREKYHALKRSDIPPKRGRPRKGEEPIKKAKVPMLKTAQKLPKEVLCFTNQQVFMLESYYRFNTTPTLTQRQALAYVIKHLCKSIDDKLAKDTHPDQIQRWFKRRQKMDIQQSLKKAPAQRDAAVCIRRRQGAAEKDVADSISAAAVATASTTTSETAHVVSPSASAYEEETDEDMLERSVCNWSPPSSNSKASSTAEKPSSKASKSFNDEEEEDEESESSSSSSSSSSEEEEEEEEESSYGFGKQRTLRYKLSKIRIHEDEEQAYACQDDKFFRNYKKVIANTSQLPRSYSFVYRLVCSKEKALIDPHAPIQDSDCDSSDEQNGGYNSADEAYTRRTKSINQQSILEAAFVEDLYVDNKRVELLRQQTKLSPSVIRKWFATRRRRCHVTGKKAQAYVTQNWGTCLHDFLYMIAFCLPRDWQNAIKSAVANLPPSPPAAATQFAAVAAPSGTAASASTSVDVQVASPVDIVSSDVSVVPL